MLVTKLNVFRVRHLIEHKLLNFLTTKKEGTKAALLSLPAVEVNLDENPLQFKPPDDQRAVNETIFVSNIRFWSLNGNHSETCTQA